MKINFAHDEGAYRRYPEQIVEFDCDPADTIEIPCELWNEYQNAKNNMERLLSQFDTLYKQQHAVELERELHSRAAVVFVNEWLRAHNYDPFRQTGLFDRLYKKAVNSTKPETQTRIAEIMRDLSSVEEEI